MAYIPRPLDTSPSTTMTIRQGGDLINDNFEAILDDLNFTSMPQVGGAPIVESGSNSDGEWTRWADGTQICHATNDIPFNVAGLHDFRFPQTFIRTLGGGILPLRGTSSEYAAAVADAALTASSTHWGAFVRTTSTVVGNPARMFASGRWK